MSPRVLTREVAGLFVTGTDTGVGKTILSAALLAAMAYDGRRVIAHKPVVTGLDEPSAGWPPDHELLASASGMQAAAVSPLRYGPAVSPHLAARLARERLDYDELLARAYAALTRAARARATLVVEGVGGLLTPLTEERSIRDFAAALGLPVLIAARPGLGTISHALLTLEGARAVGLDVRAVVLTPWPREPSALERSNRETIARLGDVEVDVLGEVEECSRAALARAAASMRWAHWLGAHPAQAESRKSTPRSAREPVREPALAAASTASQTVATS